MKNILRKILIVFILLIFSIATLSLADNETDDLELTNSDDEVAPISLEDSDTPVVDSYDDNTDEDFDDIEETASTSKNYFYAGTDDVNITLPIEGDIFVVTSGNVTIDTDIGGNAFICASSITITEDSSIDASLFSASSSLNIQGYVGINVYNVSRDFALTGTIGADLFSISSKSDLNGFIYGDANVSAENISMSDDSSIDGNFNYSSKEQINIPENAVTGETNFASVSVKSENASTKIGKIAISILSFAILTIVLFIIGKWLNCKFITTYPDFIKNLPKSLLFGFLSLILVPIASFVLLICGVTVNLAFILIALYSVLLLIASSVVVIILSKLVAKKLNVKFEKANNTLLTILSIIVLSIVYKLIQLIPILGSITIFVFLIIGIGILINNIIPNKEVKNS